MDTHHIKLLLQRYRANELSDTEMAEWETIMQSEEDRLVLQQLMEADMSVAEAAGVFDMEPWKPVLARILAADRPVAMKGKQSPVVEQVTPNDPVIADVASAEKPARIYRLRTWAWAAAAVLILVAGATWYLVTLQVTTNPPVIVQQTVIGPASEGAVLTLGNGSKIVLDSLGNGIVAMENGAPVMLKDGQLQYGQNGSDKNEVVYNTMTTPRGRQFMVTLPDGTEVWLNAESSIRFPLAFSATERRVEVTGEAFFHVKSMNLPAYNGRPAMKLPFVVSVNKQLDIEVLGTRFNVNAYTNEKAMQTTLEEGIVRVRTKDSSDEPAQAAILRPGQQASVSNTGSKKLVVQEADMAKALSWKNGLFNFEDVSLADAMRQLERWYDIDVSYEKNIPAIWFSGKMSRDTNLPGLLKILEKTGVQFRIEGRKLVVLEGQ